jgi:hypothetical protein
VLPTRKVLEDVGAGAVLLDTPSTRQLSGGARGLLAALLRVDPAARLSAAEALRHPWLASAAAGAAAVAA